ncbi:MAG: type II secretion system GspH family protein [Verrucomicrobiales bacterium]|nr:type II secretion system GspH family protein [Verrucomicrobiales bacterium]
MSTNQSHGISSSRVGFTLIELLVVIAVIGILASLSLPAISGSKRRAQRVQCMSNLRQCGIALLMYGEEYRRYPNQRRLDNGAPWDLPFAVWTPIDSGVAAEWEEVIRGIAPPYSGQALGTRDERLRVFGCPLLGAPTVLVDEPRANDRYSFSHELFLPGWSA